MAVPSALATISSGGAAQSTWGNDVKSLTDWMMGDATGGRAHWKGRMAVDDNGNPDLTIPDNTTTDIGPKQSGWYYSRDIDIGGWTNGGTDEGHLIVPEAGRYWIRGSVRYSSNATGYRSLTLRINGTVQDECFPTIGAVSGASTRIQFSDTFDLAEDDELKMAVFQNSGGTLEMQDGAYFTALWVGR